MLTSKTIKLILAIALVAGLLTVFSSTMDNGHTAAKNPITRRILRRHDKTKGPPASAETAFLRSQEKQEQEEQKKPRALKLRAFKDMPLAVSKIKNLDSDTWHQDLEVEVKNISTKPIYSILAYLSFPEHRPGNRDTGITMHFGERKYIDIRRVGDPQDPHLNPGDTYIFTIEKQYKKGLKIQHEMVAEEFKTLELHFGVISFGDGTGFQAGDFSDYRSIRIPPQLTSHHSESPLIRTRYLPQQPATSAEVEFLRAQELEKEGRQLEDTIPKHVPIKVKIKAEKEKAFKDLHNEKWLRDLEIEVTNTGTKPIYFLDLQLHLPDTKGPDGNIVGWVLLYGRTQLVSVNEPLKPTDVPINPGERYVFTIAARFVSAWEDMIREGLVVQPKRVQVLIQLINFGDGTGFWGGTAAPLPYPKKPLAADRKRTPNILL
jgi:hypothetical protein